MLAGLWLLAAVAGAALGCSPRLANNGSYLALQDCVTYYQTTLDIGTAPRANTFLVDTGSSALWLPTAECNCGGNYSQWFSSSFVGSRRQGELTVLRE